MAFKCRSTKAFYFSWFSAYVRNIATCCRNFYYTVSKLLGHKNISTTEIYAKIVDSLKKEASEKIKLSVFHIGGNLNSDQQSTSAIDVENFVS